MLGHSIDFAEVYLQRVRSEAWGLEDGIVKDGSFSVDVGIGVRALSGEKTGFAYCDAGRWDCMRRPARHADCASARDAGICCDSGTRALPSG